MSDTRWVLGRRQSSNGGGEQGHEQPKINPPVEFSSTGMLPCFHDDDAFRNCEFTTVDGTTRTQRLWPIKVGEMARTLAQIKILNGIFQGNTELMRDPWECSSASPCVLVSNRPSKGHDDSCVDSTLRGCIPAVGAMGDDLRLENSRIITSQTQRMVQPGGLPYQSKCSAISKGHDQCTMIPM